MTHPLRRALLFAAAGIAILIVVVIAVLVVGGSSEESPPGARRTAVVLPPAKVRVPLSETRINPSAEALVTTDGSDLYYVGPSGRFAVHPVPLQDTDRDALPIGSPAAIRAAPFPPANLSTAGRFPEGLLLVDSGGTVYMTSGGQRRPVALLLVRRDDLLAVREAATPLFLVAAD